MAIIELAPMPDQKLIPFTRKEIVKVLNTNGEQRPPRMIDDGYQMVGIGAQRNGDVTVFDGL